MANRNLICSALALTIVISFLGRELLSAQEVYQSSSSSRGNQWEREETFEFDDRDVRLPASGDVERIIVNWAEPEIDQLGHYCRIFGKVLVSSTSGEPTPISWDQVISVHLSRESEVDLDWSGGVDSDSVQSESQLVKLDGTFSATFDLRQTDCGTTGPRNLQVGISLADQDSTSDHELQIVASSSQSALKNSIQLVNIPSPPEQPEIIKLIDAAAQWPNQDCSAVELIRASNALRALGRDKALSAMEKYCELTGLPPGFERFSFEDDYVMYAIIQCAWEPASAIEALPSPKYLRDIGSEAQWPRNPMDISQDIPWLLGTPVMLSGVPNSPEPDIQWLHRFGKLRDQPLSPADNPLLAAQQLMDEPRFKMLNELILGETIRDLRSQSFAMVDEFLPQIENDSWGNPDIGPNWQMLLERSKEIGLYWDPASQCYKTKSP